MMEISNIIAAWGKKTEANNHELRTLHAVKAFLHVPVLPPARFFVNHMLDTLKAYPAVRAAILSAEF